MLYVLCSYIDVLHKHRIAPTPSLLAILLLLALLTVILTLLLIATRLLIAVIVVQPATVVLITQFHTASGLTLLTRRLHHLVLYRKELLIDINTMWGALIKGHAPFLF